MLANRIIPCLDIDAGRVVKGVNFINLVDAGEPLDNAKFYDEQKADEIVVLDITASSDRRNIIFDIVQEIASNIYTPFTVGGGIRTIDDMRKIIKAGADKVSINTSAIQNPDLIRQGALRFGSQAIVVAIDAKKNNKGSYDVYIHGGRTYQDLDAIEWARRAESLGAGEILLTSMDRDGTKKGYELELTRRISEAVSIPVIASGGVGKLDDMVDGFIQGKANAVLAASIFHFREYTIADARHYLRSKGIPMRDTC